MKKNHIIILILGFFWSLAPLSQAQPQQTPQVSCAELRHSAQNNNTPFPTEVLQPTTSGPCILMMRVTGRLVCSYEVSQVTRTHVTLSLQASMPVGTLNDCSHRVGNQPLTLRRVRPHTSTQRQARNEGFVPRSRGRHYFQADRSPQQKEESTEGAR